MKLFGKHITAFLIFEWLTILVAFLFPLTKKYHPGFIVLWGVFGLISMKRDVKKGPALVLCLMILFYLLHVFGLIGTVNMKAGLFALETKASFIAIPLVMLFQSQVKNRLRFNTFLAFCYGCSVYVVFSFVRAILRFQETGESKMFFYNELAGDFHPTYIAAYFCIALLFLGWLAFKNIHLFSRQFIHWVFFGVFLIYVGFLSSKAGYIGVLLVLLMLGLVWMKKKFILKGLLVMIGGTALLVLSIAVSPKSIKRLAEMTNSIERSNDVEEIVEPKIDNKGKIVKKGSTEGRIIAWNAAWAIMKEHPFGVGTGDSEAVLMKSYEEIGAIYNIEHRLNAHNQFFQSGIALGWAGLLLLCAILTMGLLVAIQKRDLLYIGFIAIVALNMMFESFLEVQSGITFVAFFYAFFVRCEFQTFQTKSKHE